MAQTEDIFATLHKQIKQFHDRMADHQTAWIFCWGYLIALKHNKIISERRCKMLESYNRDLWINP